MTDTLHEFLDEYHHLGTKYENKKRYDELLQKISTSIQIYEKIERAGVKELQCHSCTKSLGVYFDAECANTTLNPKNIYCKNCYLKEYVFE